jgi:hypothetical protein
MPAAPRVMHLKVATVFSIKTQLTSTRSWSLTPLEQG